MILSNENVVVCGQVKSENSSLPVTVRVSKTLMLKLHVSWMAAVLCDIVVIVIQATSHFDHKKRVAWVPVFMQTCGGSGLMH